MKLKANELLEQGIEFTFTYEGKYYRTRSIYKESQPISNTIQLNHLKGMLGRMDIDKIDLTCVVLHIPILDIKLNIPYTLMSDIEILENV